MFVPFGPPENREWLDTSSSEGERVVVRIKHDGCLEFIREGDASGYGHDVFGIPTTVVHVCSALELLKLLEEHREEIDR